MFLRTKEKLRNGEIIVSGDQLPLFIYQSYHYDPEDPWNGLLRSSLLVSVCSCRFRPTRGPNVHIFARLTNISLHPQVPSRRSPKRLGRGTRESMGWPKSHPLQSHTLQLRFALRLHSWLSRYSYTFDILRSVLLCLRPLFFLGRTPSPILRRSTTRCSACSKMRRRKKKSTSYWCGGTGAYLFTLYITVFDYFMGCRQIFPRYLSMRQPARKNSALTRIKQKRLEIKVVNGECLGQGTHLPWLWPWH
jgi:hypothetical protein